MGSKNAGASKKSPAKEQKRNDVNASSSPKPKKGAVTARRPSLLATILLPTVVAVAAFVFGLSTPPLMVWFEWDMFNTSEDHDNEPSNFERTADSRILQQTSDRTAPLYPCTDALLEQFLHDSTVPGFHIVCLELEKNTLNVRTYESGVQQKMAELSWTGPVSWDAFKSALTDTLKVRPADDMHQDWALFAPEGQRVLDESATEEEVGSYTQSMATKFGMVLLYQGGQFLWPGVRVGFERQISLYSIMPPGSPEYTDKNATVTLETLALKPLVLSVKGFLSPDECQHIQEEATPSMKYSDVVLMDHDQGRPASDFRTSQTTFLSARDDDVLVDIDYRTASLVRIPRNHQEPVQVLRYGKTEHYTSHHDFFSPELYQQDPGTLKLIGNGRRNRMATVFWYLSDVAEGGHTIFPRADGARERSADDCESGLKVKPVPGAAL
jgi:prolyl 4-hydroxylase